VPLSGGEGSGSTPAFPLPSRATVEEALAQVLNESRRHVDFLASETLQLEGAPGGGGTAATAAELTASLKAAGEDARRSYEALSHIHHRIHAALEGV
jgi:hypothetical protein